MYNVLLVEDEAYAIDLLLETVDWEKLGLCIKETALNGYQGYNKFVMGDFDLVITDIKMPIMNGIEMIQKIRDIDKDVELILISSYEEFEYAKKAIDANVAGYIVKPLDDDELIGTLKKVVEKLKNKAKEEEKREEAAETADDGNLLVREIKNYIDLNISKKITIKDVASHFVYSPNYVGKLFKAKTGTSINEYITYVKMNKAVRMLKVMHNQIADIAYGLGYDDVAYFTKKFKDYFKITPTAYRNRLMDKKTGDDTK